MREKHGGFRGLINAVTNLMTSTLLWPYFYLITCSLTCVNEMDFHALKFSFLHDPNDYVPILSLLAKPTR